jgi:23S rRNA G2445 N2-methylase RlmL
MIIDELRVIGSTQTNKVMHAELLRVAKRALGTRPPEPRKEGLGQLVYPFDRELASVAVTYLRTPTRVVWDLYRSRAQRLEPLYDELLADVGGDRRTLFRDGEGISIEARHVEDFAAGERQIVGTVKNALLDACARRGTRLRVDPERATTRLVARLDAAGELVVSIDLGGGSLSRRGWRREHGEAPLREHLAAVLLVLARFDPRADVLVDPMCGAGTIAIESVHAARATPRTQVWHGVARANAQPLFPDAKPLVIGCDVDLDVLAAARDNARAARCADDITWQRADIRDLAPATIDAIARERGREAPPSGLLLTNPPYGERLDERELEPLYAAIAHSCLRFPGWRAAFLIGNPLLEHAFARVGLQPRIKKPLANGNLRAYFLLFDL